MDFIYGLGFTIAFIVILVPIYLVKKWNDEKRQFKLVEVYDANLKELFSKKYPNYNGEIIQFESRGFTKEDSKKDARFRSEFFVGGEFLQNKKRYEIIDVIKVLNTNLAVGTIGTNVLVGSSGVKNQETTKIKDGNLLASKWVITAKFIS